MRVVAALLLVPHVAAGTTAVGGGLVALVTTKGGRRHRAAGRVFAAAMLGVVVTAAMLTAIAPDAYFAALTVGAAAPAFSGYRVVRRRRPDLDPRQRATALDWAVTLALLAVAIPLAAMALRSPAMTNRGLILALAGAAAAHASYDLWRFAAPTAWPRGPRVWLFEHIVRMVASYFAAVAAFSGSVLLLLDPPWRQLWAVILGQWLTVFFLVRHRRGPPNRAAALA